jgi:hypothetical protein
MNLKSAFLQFLYKGFYWYCCSEFYVKNQLVWLRNVTICSCSIQKVISFFWKDKKRMCQYGFVHEGILSNEFSTNDIESEPTLNMLKISEPVKFDFIIRNDYTDKNNGWINNKIIYPAVPDTIEYKVSNAYFLSFILNVNGKEIDIQWTTRDYNYMIVGNKFDKPFLFYFVKRMGEDISFDDFVYTGRFITNNIQVGDFDSTQTLTIEESSVLT